MVFLWTWERFFYHAIKLLSYMGKVITNFGALGVEFTNISAWIILQLAQVAFLIEYKIVFMYKIHKII